MDKHEVANILNEMAVLLDLKGENPFKVRAYENAARIIEALTDNLKELVDSQKLTSIKGIGSNLSDHIKEIVLTGKLKEHTKLKSSIPNGIIEMLKIPGLGPKKTRHIWEEMGIETVGELELACNRHLLSHIEGFGEKTEAKILAGIEMLKKFSGKRLFPEALQTAKEIHSQISLSKEVIRSAIAGSIRRKKEVIGDIDILVSSNSPKRIMDKFTALPQIERILEKGDTKAEVILENGMQCDLRTVTDEEYPFALHYFTGSKEHNVEMRSIAKKKGLKLNEYGLFKGNGKKSIACKDEADLFQKFGLEYIEPELRENTGEIEAAAHKKLPNLISADDLTGLFHVHSKYTDGECSISEMAHAAKSMGMKYISINDHSKILAMVHGLDEEDLIKQHKEIDSINKELGEFKILKGIEVDILADGSIDLSDKILSDCDMVIAAIHTRFGMPEEEMTERIIKGISNPHVHALAHPTGRLFLAREPYAVDIKRVIDVAAQLHIAMEINSHPQRLDLDWRWCKYAKEKGAKFIISPDAHSTAGLSDIVYGIGVARKGWLEKSDVLNCLPIDRLLKYLRNKNKNS